MSPSPGKIVGFCCSYCGYSSADLAGRQKRAYSPQVMIVRVPCTGRVDVVHILKAFRHGADAVLVAGCLEKNCNFHNGNFEARKRVKQVKGILESLGMEGKRVEMFNVASNQAWKFVEIVDEMVSRADELGPSPLREVNK